jgi:hypothetical protein
MPYAVERQYIIFQSGGGFFMSANMSAQVKQVRDLRALFQLMTQQQEGILMHISDKLDEIEACFSALDSLTSNSDADGTEGDSNGK